MIREQRRAVRFQSAGCKYGFYDHLSLLLNVFPLHHVGLQRVRRKEVGEADRQSVGGIGFRRFPEFQKSPHHEGDLRFLSGPAPYDGELHALGEYSIIRSPASAAAMTTAALAAPIVMAV